MIKAKAGRNDPCWCGSGKKHKRCHLNREKAAPFTRADLEAHRKQIGAIAKCLAKDLDDAQCSPRIVSAHTISKSGSLKQIAEDGHVMGTKVTLSALIENSGKITLSKVGINKASTFTGFCARHDKQLFAPVEDHPVTLSDQQLFLLAYRSISRELFLKEANVRTAELMRQADQGMEEAMQFMVQQTATGFAAGVDLALRELNFIKTKMDEILKSSAFADMHHYVVELSSIPFVLVSASTQPEFDFNGARLQSFGRADIPMSHIIFNCISYDNAGCFVFSWIKEHHEICRKFIDSLADLEKTELANALVRFSYSFAENTWASPVWWRSRDDSVKKDISDRLQHGTPLSPHRPSCLMTNGINFGALQVESAGYR
ncbi:YecA family protein [Massilia brevitalea]|uniref:YecA family protein n=1 Tax=Massilia brevitalea TaxID=442526 RepID=UPI002739F490|nr:SEC-C domain-containing protein [Massilia brevitalea]